MVAAFVVAAGCARPAAPPPAPQVAGEPPAPPASPAGHPSANAVDPVVGTHAALTVVASDVRDAVAWRAARSGADPEAALAALAREDDATLRRIIAAQLDEVLLERECEALGIRIEPAALAAAFAERSPGEGSHAGGRAPNDASPTAASPVARRMLQRRLLYEAWVERRLAAVSEQELRTAWERDGHRLTIEAVVLPNRVDRETLQAIVVNEPEAIDAYYRDFQSQFVLPRAARVRQIGLRVARDDDRPAARARLELLRDRAEAEGIDAVLSETELPGDPTILVYAEQAPAVMATDVGRLSPVVDDRFSVWFAHVDEHRPRTPRPLDDALRLEIAGRLARARGIAPTAAAEAAIVLEAMRAGAESLVREAELRGWLVERPRPFARPASPVVPTVGTSEEAVAWLFEPTRAAGDVFGPVLTTEGVAVIRVVDVARADPAAFEAAHEQFATAWTAGLRDRAWTERLAELSRTEAREIDVAALRAWALAALGVGAESALRPAPDGSAAPAEGGNSSPHPVGAPGQ